MNFEPLGNRVLVDMDEVTQSEGGIYIPASSSAGPRKGTVVSCGPHYAVGATLVESPLKAGDRVLVSDIGAAKLRVEGKDLLVVRHEDIIGKFKE